MVLNICKDWNRKKVDRSKEAIRLKHLMMLPEDPGDNPPTDWVVARLSSAPFGGPVTEPAAVVLNFTGELEAILEKCQLREAQKIAMMGYKNKAQH